MFQTIPFLGRLSTIYNRLVIKVQKWFYHIISQADRHFLEYHHFDPSQITIDFKCRNIKESDILMHPRKQLKRKVRSGDSSGKGGSKPKLQVICQRFRKVSARHRKGPPYRLGWALRLWVFPSPDTKRLRTLDPVGSTVRYEMMKLCTRSVEDTMRR